jgi:hypothetical protein
VITTKTVQNEKLVATWAAACCLAEDGSHLDADDAVASFESWCTTQGIANPPTSLAFRRTLSSRVFGTVYTRERERKRVPSYRGWRLLDTGVEDVVTEDAVVTAAPVNEEPPRGPRGGPLSLAVRLRRQWQQGLLGCVSLGSLKAEDRTLCARLNTTPAELSNALALVKSDLARVLAADLAERTWLRWLDDQNVRDLQAELARLRKPTNPVEVFQPA